MLGVKDIDRWPTIDKKLIGKEKIKIKIQFNGKTRDVLEVEKDLSEKEIVKLCESNIKINERLKINIENYIC